MDEQTFFHGKVQNLKTVWIDNGDLLPLILFHSKKFLEMVRGADIHVNFSGQKGQIIVCPLGFFAY